MEPCRFLCLTDMHVATQSMHQWQRDGSMGLSEAAAMAAYMQAFGCLLCGYFLQSVICDMPVISTLNVY